MTVQDLSAVRQTGTCGDQTPDDAVLGMGDADTQLGPHIPTCLPHSPELLLNCPYS